MKKVIAGFVATILLIVSALAFTGCGNMDVFYTNHALNYIIVEEGGSLPILHEVQSWSDSRSDATMVRTKCCKNYIWTSSNNSTLYENIPDYLTEGVDYIKCSHIGE